MTFIIFILEICLYDMSMQESLGMNLLKLSKNLKFKINRIYTLKKPGDGTMEGVIYLHTIEIPLEEIREPVIIPTPQRNITGG